MPLKYFPLTRIIQNKYTRGDQFRLPDGTSYTGRYYITYDNKVYTGANPVLGTNILLTDILAIQNRGVREGNFTPSTSAYAKALPPGNVSSNPDAELVSLAPYYPFPVDSDYARGYFTRYFAKSVSGPGYVLEISELDWTKIQDGNVSDTVLGYQTMDMLWQITGPLYDTRKSQYQIIGGVYTTNKRVTENKQKGFKGIVEFIGGDYTKFARLDGGEVISVGDYTAFANKDRVTVALSGSI